MSLTERFDRLMDDDDACRAWAVHTLDLVERDPLAMDLLMGTVATALAATGADLMTLRRRTREIVDLAVLIQAEGVAQPPARPAGRPSLTVVGGRDA